MYPLDSKRNMKRFADYFVICGLDIASGLEPDKYSGDNLHASPLDRCYKCKILGHYPEKVPQNPFDAAAVSMLCLPNGLKFRTQKHSVTQTPTFHSFLITRENGKRCYGFSLVFYEEIRNRDICAAMQTLQAMYLTELSNQLSPPVIQNLQQQQQQTSQSRSLPKHFKVSNTSLKQQQSSTSNQAINLAYYDISKDKLFASKSIAIICRQKAFVYASRQFLENLYRCATKKSHNHSNCTEILSLESYVFNFIYEVELPEPGKSLLLYLPPADPLLPTLMSVVLQNSAPPLELPLLDYSLKLMFTWLGVDVVLQLFTCLLMEIQVLVRSSDCQKLMVVCEGITSLLFPFTWPHVYVPLLPAALHHFLDAPLPYLMGLYAPADHLKVAITQEATLCYVDIDKARIQLPEEIVQFPHLSAFTAEICSVLDKHSVVQQPFTKESNTSSSSTCTLPSRCSHMARRKHSIHDILDSAERPPSPPGSARTEALQRIADIVRRTGVSLGTAHDLNQGITSNDNNTDDCGSYADELRFNNAIREVFLNRFVHMFVAYENFVIYPPAGGASTTQNDSDSVQNFDKAAYLSDQPEHHRRFLWRFLETQMFASLIDLKILTAGCPKKIDSNLAIFDHRIALVKQRYDGENLYNRAVLSYEPSTMALETMKLIEERLRNPDFESPQPREILHYSSSRKTTHNHRHFPLLDRDVLNRKPVTSTGSIPRLSATRKESQCMSKQVELVTKPDPSPALLAQANWTFVEKLLKDCKAKTKRMLLAKLGAEGVTLSGCSGSGVPLAENLCGGAVEENTLVASLCDFLERVWSHGLTRKRGKSALWTHLMAYQDVHKSENLNCLKYVQATRRTSTAENRTPNVEQVNRLNTEQMAQLPNSLLFDVLNIQAMPDVRTSIGMARAWIRLALEKKHLSKHLRCLLSDQSILKAFYKRAAFLRCDEEKEQFLYHILSLNAVDYFCFTSTYPTTVIPYRIVIVPSKKGTTTSANLWIVLSGTLSETRRICVPKATLNFEHRNQNVGVLTTLRIGHDNSGLYAKFMVDSVVVRNEITGHTYKFLCGRWLGKGVDDGSTERLLVGTLLPPQLDGEDTVLHLVSALSTSISTVSGGGNTSTTSSQQMPSTSATPYQASQQIAGSLPLLKPSQIQHKLGDCVSNIVRWQYCRASERRTTLTVLLCGENGLVKCLENVFQFGFKSAKMFVGKNYLWDYLVRVKEQFQEDLFERTSTTTTLLRSQQPQHYQETVAVWRCYCHLVEAIGNCSKALGKDGKFELFICLSVREHVLHRILVPMSICRITTEMYEEKSFLRNRGLLTFLRQILLPLDELDVVLENSVTHGISSVSSIKV